MKIFQHYEALDQREWTRLLVLLPYPPSLSPKVLPVYEVTADHLDLVLVTIHGIEETETSSKNPSVGGFVDKLSSRASFFPVHLSLSQI